jgi:hypothetical protein
MADTKTYTGSCHCGAVRYEVDLGDLSSVVSCNCSMCGRMGWLLTFVPATQFRLLSGEDVLRDYQFGRKHIHHQFCSRCGTRSFSLGTDQEGREVRSINVRCLDGVDLDALSVTKFDGKSL